jgi:hypothetical protein
LTVVKERLMSPRTSAQLALFCIPLALAGLSASAQEKPSTAVAGVHSAPAPAFKVGDVVVDRNGNEIGVVAGVGEGGQHLMQLIVKIDGKLVTVPETVLSFQNGRLVSTRSKSELLAAVSAPAAG